jgi:protein-S-isoprenylcysteine O-methyltransferase Ste14
MPFEEKTTWVSVVIGLLVPVVYFATVLPQLADTPAADIAYQRALIVAAIASIILIIIVRRHPTVLSCQAAMSAVVARWPQAVVSS